MTTNKHATQHKGAHSPKTQPRQAAAEIPQTENTAPSKPMTAREQAVTITQEIAAVLSCHGLTMPADMALNIQSFVIESHPHEADPPGT